MITKLIFAALVLGVLFVVASVVIAWQPYGVRLRPYRAEVALSRQRAQYVQSLGVAFSHFRSGQGSPYEYTEHVTLLLWTHEVSWALYREKPNWRPTP